MVGDLIFAIIPMILIWRLSRSVVERCLITFLMTMGLFATGAGVLKILYSKTFDKTSPDVFREMMPVFLWCRMEEVLLMVAASAPLLKSPIVHALHRLGLATFRNKTRELNSFHSFHHSATCHGYNLSNLEGRPAGSQGMETDEERLEAGEYTSSTASVHCKVLDGFDAGDRSE
jgi:hypothetical protein